MNFSFDFSAISAIRFNLLEVSPSVLHSFYTFICKRLFQLMFDPKMSPKNLPVKGLIFWQFTDCLNFDKFRDIKLLLINVIARYPGVL